jgi:hypothetical protein
MAQQYVNIEKRPNCIRLTLTAEGKVFVQEAIDDGTTNVESDSFLSDLLEYNTSNGWTLVKPEDVGALTSAPILSDDFDRDENTDKLRRMGEHYWHERYQIESAITEMVVEGYVDFQKGEE